MCPAGSRNHQYRSDGLRPAGLNLGYISDAPIYRRSDFHAARHWSGICNEPSARDSQIPFEVLSWIGSESCRESVWQYVWIVWVGVSVNKAINMDNYTVEIKNRMKI